MITMDDSDDYFPDDLVFDDQALAALEEVEKQHFSDLPSQSPIVKRRRTDIGWRANNGSGTQKSEDPWTDLPEVAVVGDGSYAFGNSQNQPLRHSNSRPEVQYQQRAELPRVIGPSSSTAQPVHKRSTQPTRLNGHSSNASMTRSNHSQQSIRQNLQPAPHDSQALAQLDALRRQLEHFREENDKMQNALRVAMDDKLAKEGEVTVLRSNIQKTASEHAAQIAKLKSAKDEGELRQLQMQKEAKEELERIKTQFVFKQQELEASARKVPPSVRGKRPTRDFPATPMPMSSQFSAWGAPPPNPVRPDNPLDDTPSRPRRIPARTGSPSKRQSRSSPEAMRFNHALPGFHNAFMDSTPMRPTQHRLAPKSTQQGFPTLVFPPSQHQSSSPKNDNSALPRFSDSSPPSSPLISRSDPPEDVRMNEEHAPHPGEEGHKDEDAVMADDLEDPFTVEEYEEITAWDYKTEMFRTIIYHKLPQSSQPTFQSLLSVSPLPEGWTRYTVACGSVLEVFADAPKQHDLATASDQISQSFLTMIEVLRINHNSQLLGPLFHLLTLLIYAFPDFHLPILSQPAENGGSHLLFQLAEIVRAHMDPSLEDGDAVVLSKQTLGLLEVLARTTSGGDKIMTHPNVYHTLLTLLKSTQPVWLLADSVRILIFLASSPHLHRSLIPPRVDEPMQTSQNEPGKPRVVCVEQLCAYLVDPLRDNKENQELQTLILTFFAQLSISHPDAHKMLLGVPSFIPSLIIFLSHLTAPFWEEDDNLISSPTATTSLLRIANQTLFLLHHLIFAAEPPCNLRHKLRETSHRPYNTTTHHFLVTFGRLSYAECPDWVNEPDRATVETLSEIAKELLALVVDGPEGESVWAAFQLDGEADDGTDEEEMEARLLGHDPT